MGFNYPCLCLNLGFFLLMMYNTPLRRTILQSALLFLTEVLTFMVQKLFIPEGYSSLVEVIWTHFYLHPVARKNLDVVHPHLSGNVGYNLMAVTQLHPEHGVAQRFGDRSVLFD